MPEAAPAPALLRPEQRPDAAELLFSSSGRLSRLPFIAGEATVLGVLWLYDRWASGWPRRLTGWAVLLVLLFSGCCLVARRLHDLGRSGWWTAGVWGLFVLAWGEPRGPIGSGCAVIMGLLALALAGLPGQRRANRFGPPLG